MKKLQKNLTNKQMGFTLIELLIVIGIIGILVGLLTVNYVNQRQRARDTERKTDLGQIQSALEFHRSDRFTYPTVLKNCPAGPGANSLMAPDCSAGSTVYMEDVPEDPLTGINYIYQSVGDVYCLRACLENDQDPDRDPPTATFPNCPGLTSCATGFPYTVENP